MLIKINARIKHSWSHNFLLPPGAELNSEPVKVNLPSLDFHMNYTLFL